MPKAAIIAGFGERFIELLPNVVTNFTETVLNLALKKYFLSFAQEKCILGYNLTVQQLYPIGSQINSIFRIVL